MSDLKLRTPPARPSVGVQRVPYTYRGTVPETYAWLAAQRASGRLHTYGEDVKHYADGTVEVSVVLTEPRHTRDDGTSFKLVTAGALGLVIGAGVLGTTLAVSLALALAASMDADTATMLLIALALLVLGGGGTTCAGLHCAGCSH